MASFLSLYTICLGGAIGGIAGKLGNFGSFCLNAAKVAAIEASRADLFGAEMFGLLVAGLDTRFCSAATRSYEEDMFY